MKPLRWALAGLDHHYTALNLLRTAGQNSCAELAAVWHHCPDQLQEAVEGISVRTAPEWSDLCTDPEIDLVVSMSPPRLNQKILTEAMEHGKHVISVKPGAFDLEGVQALQACAQRNGVVLFPAECLGRISAVDQYAKSLVDQGALGDLLSISQVVHGRPPQHWPGGHQDSWWVDPAQAPGGGWIDHSIYTVDLTRWLTGSAFVRATGFTANVTYKELPLEDYGVGILQLASGAVANLEVTWHRAPESPARSTIHILGSRGAVAVDNLLGKLAVSRHGQGDWSFEDLPQAEKSLNIVEHVAASIQEGRAPAGSAWDQVQNFAACLAVYDSAKTGKTVSIPQS